VREGGKVLRDYSMGYVQKLMYSSGLHGFLYSMLDKCRFYGRHICYSQHAKLMQKYIEYKYAIDKCRFYGRHMLDLCKAYARHMHKDIG
jgi:hypothetical protein